MYDSSSELADTSAGNRHSKPVDYLAELKAECPHRLRPALEVAIDRLPRRPFEWLTGARADDGHPLATAQSRADAFLVVANLRKTGVDITPILETVMDRIEGSRRTALESGSGDQPMVRPSSQLSRVGWGGGTPYPSLVTRRP